MGHAKRAGKQSEDTALNSDRRETMPGAEFKRVRQALNLSQDEFAIELGYEGTQQGNRTTIKRFETGERPLSLPVAKLVYMMSLYGVPEWPEYLEAQPAEKTPADASTDHG
jgi:transcriptional regulator with XRE-family HTH domain